MLVSSRFDEKSLGFDNLTVVPYERKLFDTKLLTKANLDHINKYHAQVAIKMIIINL